ncbi:MAG TPA: hypothetical protein VHL80_07890 [Polyangia bacterium]|nr:hypothetical protein [Polyangia bacterium]
MQRILRALHWRLASLVVAVVLGGACSHEIGDACKSSVDCDPNGTRSCDLSQPGGYCTVVGCDTTACPSGSTCIRTFPETFLALAANITVMGQTCDPAPAMSACPTDSVCASFGFCVRSCDPTASPTTCPGGQLCSSMGYCAQCDPALEDIPSATGPTQDNCLADETCLDTGLCAKQSFEQRECAKSCSSNGDCRSGYDCRKTGALGSMVLATDPNARTAFCAPHVTPVVPPAP